MTLDPARAAAIGGMDNADSADPAIDAIAPNFPSMTAPERLADGIIHAVSLVGVLIAFAFLLPMAGRSGNSAVLVANMIYAAGVVVSICVSFAYHLHPRHEWRAKLRRWDHAAIYPVIAGTFTPLLVICATPSAYAILGVIWITATVGVWFKLSGDNGDSKWSLASYIGLGWFALFALPDFWSQLPHSVTYAIAAGGLFYTVGTVFYRRKGMRYRYPIWHALGTCGGASFLTGIWIAVSS